MDATLSTCISQISKLEPLLGIGLAFNLAYLNLPIFSFLTSVSRGVESCLEGLPSTAREEIKDTPWFKDALSLSRVHTLLTLDLHEENPWWIRFKSPVNALLFNVLYHYRMARFGSAVGALFGVLGIVVGVGATLEPSQLCFQPLPTSILFWVSVWILVWPIFCVSAGAWVRLTTLRELRYNLKNLGKKAWTEAAGEIQKVEEAITGAGA